jgi:hypothetical protein
LIFFIYDYEGVRAIVQQESPLSKLFINMRGKYCTILCCIRESCQCVCQHLEKRNATKAVGTHPPGYRNAPNIISSFKKNTLRGWPYSGPRKGIVPEFS